MPTQLAYPPNDTKIEITKIKGDLLDNKTRLKCRCSFCDKHVAICHEKKTVHDIITSGRGFHCSFCVKHNFYTRQSKHILGMSFRGIIAQYYYCLYRSTPTKMYLSELKEYIELHERLGSNNPLFLYDPESYCWFIDFSKVGRHKKELSLKYVLATTAEILASFNLYKYYPDLQGYPLYQKFHDAILEFYSKRSRPADKRILSPTLIKCGTIFSTEAKVTLEDTRGFSAQNLIPMDKFK